MNILRYICGLVVLVLVAAVGELVSDEIRARLDRIPLALLAAAARRLPAELRGRALHRGLASRAAIHTAGR